MKKIHLKLIGICLLLTFTLGCTGGEGEESYRSTPTEAPKMSEEDYRPPFPAGDLRTYKDLRIPPFEDDRIWYCFGVSSVWEIGEFTQTEHYFFRGKTFEKEIEYITERRLVSLDINAIILNIIVDVIVGEKEHCSIFLTWEELFSIDHEWNYETIYLVGRKTTYEEKTFTSTIIWFKIDTEEILKLAYHYSKVSGGVFIDFWFWIEQYKVIPTYLATSNPENWIIYHTKYEEVPKDTNSTGGNL